MLFGHPLWWMLIGLGGLVHLMPGFPWSGTIEPVFTGICMFTGLSLVAYMAFRFMPYMDRLLRL